VKTDKWTIDNHGNLLRNGSVQKCPWTIRAGPYPDRLCGNWCPLFQIGTDGSFKVESDGLLWTRYVSLHCSPTPVSYEVDGVKE
jgi:hypothetical protein